MTVFSDEWARDSLRTLQSEVQILDRDLHGRKGEENGGGLKGDVRRLQKQVDSLEKVIDAGFARIYSWLMALTAALVVAAVLVTVLIVVQ